MGNYRETYEKNCEALEKYPWWRYGELPSFEKLTENARCIDEKLYISTKINTKPFFRDLSKPLLVRNEYNSYHFAYLTDNVRASEDFGGDNHIYMYYESRDDFYRLLQAVDITLYLGGRKIVFLLEEGELTEHYPLDFKREYGIDYEAMGSKPVRVEEIKRIVVNSMRKTLSGNFFFAEVLDYHPNLLTLPGFGISDFGYLYIKTLKGMAVKSVWKKLIDNESPAIKVILEGLFYNTPYVGILQRRPTFNRFMEILMGLFPKDYIPTEQEWFTSLYLAYNMAMGRSLNDRIAPAIVFNEHGITWTGMREKKHIVNLFFYKKLLVIFRNPIIALGSRLESRIQLRPTEYSLMFWMNNDFLKTIYCLYVKNNDELLPFTKVIRFEDLKLEPKATLESLCDDFDIPWNDMLLKVTCNGNEFAMTGDITTVGIKGFDTRPVYNKHERVLSENDYYRLRILLRDIYAPWGYKFLTETDTKQSNESILAMFCKPFRFEKYNYTFRNLMTSVEERMEFLKLVKEVMGMDCSNLLPIPWLKPKAELIKSELYE